MRNFYLVFVHVQIRPVLLKPCSSQGDEGERAPLCFLIDPSHCTGARLMRVELGPNSQPQVRGNF